MWHTYNILRSLRQGGLIRKLIYFNINRVRKQRLKNMAEQYETNMRYREKFDRIQNAIYLKPYDRPPVALEYDILPARLTGISAIDYFYNQKLGNEKFLETNRYFDFDGVFFPFAGFGELIKVVDLHVLKMPGTFGLSDDQMYQLIETNYMKEEEYDEFLADGTKYIGKKILPQMAGLFKKRWPSFVLGLFKTIIKLQSFSHNLINVLNKTEEAGTPIFCGSLVGFSGVPYDYLADFFRGLRGISRDIHRIPEKVKLLANKIEPYMVLIAKLMADTTGVTNIFMPLHRGDANFLSFRQFEEFYWPSFKKLLLDLIDLNLVPIPSFEGYWTADHFRLFKEELPKCKIIFNLDGPTDIFMAHDILAGHSCLMGNVNHQDLVIGTPEKVKAYCRKLIDHFSETGLILSPGIGLPENAKMENIHAMVEAAKEYK
ncbi:MAG: uroporphyrinogen decarboxylase family protein [Candidatus Helarchaeota archaeon]